MTTVVKVNLQSSLEFLQQLNEMGTPAAGDIVYNSDDEELQVYTGTEWSSMEGGNSQVGYISVIPPAGDGAMGGGIPIEYDSLYVQANSIALDGNAAQGGRYGGYIVKFKKTGRYRVDMWGGGANKGGAGGHIEFQYNFQGGQPYMVIVAGRPDEYCGDNNANTGSDEGGWPDGGSGQGIVYGGFGAGGSTRWGTWVDEGWPLELSTFETNSQIIAVAGGGGGNQINNAYAGGGGGLEGSPGVSGSYGAGAGSGGSKIKVVLLGLLSLVMVE